MGTETVAEYAASFLCPTPVVVAVIVFCGLVSVAVILVLGAMNIYFQWYYKRQAKEEIQELVAELLLKNALKTFDERVDKLQQKLKGQEDDELPEDDEGKVPSRAEQIAERQARIKGRANG